MADPPLPAAEVLAAVKQKKTDNNVPDRWDGRSSSTHWLVFSACAEAGPLGRLGRGCMGDQGA